MTQYTAHVTLRLPLAMAEIAAAIGRTMDPDVGGSISFRRDVITLGDEFADPPVATVYADTISVSTPCRQQFADNVPYLLANPAVLHGMIQADYADRWPEITPPTLADCQAFCVAVIPDDGGTQVALPEQSATKTQSVASAQKTRA